MVYRWITCSLSSSALLSCSSSSRLDCRAVSWLTDSISWSNFSRRWIDSAWDHKEFMTPVIMLWNICRRNDLPSDPHPIQTSLFHNVTTEPIPKVLWRLAIDDVVGVVQSNKSMSNLWITCSMHVHVCCLLSSSAGISGTDTLSIATCNSSFYLIASC